MTVRRESADRPAPFRLLLRGAAVSVCCLIGLSASASARQDAPASKPAPADPVLQITVLPQKEIFAEPGFEAMTRRISWVKGLRYLVPTRAEVEKPSNAMRLAQIRLLAIPDSGHGDALITISGDIGGSVEDNVARWVGQFSELQGVPTQQDLILSKEGLRITEVIVTGTYTASMAGADAEPQKDTTLYGAVVEGGPEGTVFIKAVGPKQTLAARKGAWDMITRNLRVTPKPELRKDEPQKPQGEQAPPKPEKPEQPEQPKQ